MDKLSFQEFKRRYEKITIKDGFGRIANDEELFKMFVAMKVIRNFDLENIKAAIKDGVNEKETDFTGRD